MSAVPKKKLCWNCEGNIVCDIDNCPYCGVYVHSPELDEINNWTASYTTEDKTEEIPSPFYQLHPEQENSDKLDETVDNSLISSSLIYQLKNDVFPTLLLMSGSIFFLFGIVLLLFSHNGTLTLQWNSNLWPYLLVGAVACVIFGWRLLLRADQNNHSDLD